MKDVYYDELIKPAEERAKWLYPKVEDITWEYSGDGVITFRRGGTFVCCIDADAFPPKAMREMFEAVYAFARHDDIYR